MYLHYFVFVAVTFSDSLYTIKVAADSANRTRLMNDLISTYMKEVIPDSQTGSGPVNVKLSLSILRIERFADDKILHLDSILRMSWFDSRLRFSPDHYGGVDMIRLPSNQLWMPDIILSNSAEDPKPLPAHIKVVVTPDGGVFFSSHLKLKSYCASTPQCTSRGQSSQVACQLKVTSWSYDGLLLDLSPDDPEGEGSLAEFEADFNDDWDIESFKAKRNAIYYDCCDEPYIDVIFTAKLVRR